eukprot:GHVS01061710.1.p1 GENE.GHVS01061710.1~~GHVS01061710.1.p1  ORF type:complete len:170 (-),score=30.28 GHVS01061710.1:15-524(-)
MNSRGGSAASSFIFPIPSLAIDADSICHTNNTQITAAPTASVAAITKISIHTNSKPTIASSIALTQTAQHHLQQTLSHKHHSYNSRRISHTNNSVIKVAPESSVAPITQINSRVKSKATTEASLVAVVLCSLCAVVVCLLCVVMCSLYTVVLSSSSAVVVCSLFFVASV